MISYKNIFSKSSFKALLSCLTVVGMMSCGGGNNDRNNEGPNQRPFGGKDLPAFFNKELNIPAGSQLYSLKGSDSSGGSSSTRTASTNSGTNQNNNDLDSLFIINREGDATRYLDGGQFDALHVVKDGSKTVYIARLTKDFMNKHNLWSDNGGSWLILKQDQKPIRVSNRKDGWGGGDFVGQTETDGYLGFSDGNIVNLNGAQAPFVASLGKVTRVTHISGDMAGIIREVHGKSIAQIFHLSGTKFLRKGFGEHFVPTFVEVKAGMSLLSNSNKNLSFGSSPTTQISSLEEEFKATGDDRAPALKPSEIGNCLWFNSAIKVPKEDAALMICYKSNSKGGAYQLAWISHDGTKWNVEKLLKLTSDKANGQQQPFVQGDGFTIMQTTSDYYHISHATKKVTKLNLKFSTLFEARPSDDMKSFDVLGESNVGDQEKISFDSDAKEKKRVNIEIK